MRSVSSANNLRKVHAKKEAERAEMEGRTPTSNRSLAAPTSNSLSEEDDEEDEGEEGGEGEGREGTHSGSPGSTAAGGGEGEGEEEEGTQERHEAFMSKIFPHGVNGAGLRGRAGVYFPRHEKLGPSGSDKVVTKTEAVNGGGGGNKEEDHRDGGDGRRDSEMTDPVSRTRVGLRERRDTSEKERRSKGSVSASKSPPEIDGKPVATTDALPTK